MHRRGKYPGDGRQRSNNLPLPRWVKSNEEDTIMRRTIPPPIEGNQPLPEGANIFSRKVARSGHISFEGRPYFISKALAGRYIRLVVLADRMIVDTAIPLHKEYSLG